MGRARGARGPRREHHQRGSGRGMARGGGGAACRRRRSCDRTRPGSRDRRAADDARGCGAGAGQQQLGGERRARPTTGKPIVSNDPHRDVTNPSLRYIMHLIAPGWNVIGAQEPPFVGVAHRAQRPPRVGPHDHRHRSARRVRRGGEPGESERSAIQRRVGAAEDRPRRDPDQGRGAARRRAQVQPPRPDLLRGREEPPRVRAAVGDERAGHRRRTSADCVWRRRATARSFSTRRCTGRRRPRT